MAPGSFEFRDFDIAGVPRYAQRGATDDPGPAEDFAAYGEDPDKVPGASAQGSGNELQDPDAAHGIGEELADEPPAWLRFGDLVEDEPATDDGRVTDGTPVGDEDLLDDGGVIPEQSAAADADSVSVAEDTAHPEAADAADRKFGDETADPDEAAAIIAEQFGLDPAEARRLVTEAMSDLDAEAANTRDETDQADNDADPDETDEHEDEAEVGTAENTSSKDRVVSFLRRVASVTGEVTRNEAAEFAEGARAVAGDFREWYAGKDERSRERALARARKEVEKQIGKWDRFEEQRSRTGIEAPRGDEDR